MDPQWWEFVSAIEIDGVVLEGARFLMQWRPGSGAAQAKYNCGLLFRRKRVYAVDYDPDGQHTNSVGKGRPFYKKRIGPGTHEHTWSEDGIGYAEPIDPNFSGLDALFQFFCVKTHLTVVGGYSPPPVHQLDMFNL
jgi:hypothetical protein